MTLHGLSLLAGAVGTPTGVTFHAQSPADGAPLRPAYHEASPTEVAIAARAAAEAFPVFSRVSAVERAALLSRIADGLVAHASEIADRFVAETGLPSGRAQGELERTCGQLRLFATLITGPEWAEPRQDPALPSRQPQPRPELRSLLRPIGPVAVFGPANFPLAFGVAGGDTASALAAGCPVVVKAHSSHPGVSELVGRIVAEAVRDSRLPAGVFSVLFGGGAAVGGILLEQPYIKGAGFTGSRSVGTTLFRLCANRPQPIPFFGELSSINPVFLLPAALAERTDAIADGLAASMTLGCGQFCTNPGLVVHRGRAADLERFTARLVERLRTTPHALMLNTRTRREFTAGVARLAATPNVRTLLRADADAGSGPASPALFACDVATFLARPALHEEVFGPCTLLVAAASLDEMLTLAAHLEGQLTASFHHAGDDLATAAPLVAALETLAGRLVFDGWPTGVEVCSAMVHGGPWPATTDSRFTSVGTGAIRRWLRPVCWQNAPVAALPLASSALPP